MTTTLTTKHKPIVINLFAGPGAGKSTIACELFSILKKNNIKCEYASEKAKDITYEESYNVLKNQIYVMGNQYHRLWRLKDKVDVIVTDSPILLGMAYSDKYHYIIKELFDEFHNDNYFITRTKKYMTYGRSQTEEQAKELDLKIRNILNPYDYQIVNYDTAAQYIAEKYIKKLNANVI